MRIVRTILAFYLILVAGFSLGVVVMHSKIWPYEPIFNVYHFVQGHIEEETSLVDKIANDLGIKPSRHFGNSPISGLADAVSLNGKQLKSRRRQPVFYRHQSFMEEFLVMSGIFDFEKALNGALLLDIQTGTIAHQWLFDDKVFFNNAKQYDHHLFTVLPDGSVIFSKEEGDGALYRYSSCGELLWKIPGSFHHSITKRKDNLYWVLGSPQIVNQSKDTISLLEVDSGTIVKTIFLDEVHLKNQDKNVFSLKWVSHNSNEDKFHVNDADPLLENLAASVPQFDVGDLLVSYRHANLVYVLDPDTLDVKWWTQGNTSGQHDPDWQNTGFITIFDNQVQTTGTINIREFDLTDSIGKVIFDAADLGLGTQTRGRHQYLSDSSLLLTIPDQGRAVVVSKYGEILMDFINSYDSHDVLHLNNAMVLNKEYFDLTALQSCGA